MADNVDKARIRGVSFTSPAKLKKSEYDDLIPILKRLYDDLWGEEFVDE
tara:strand:- start:193 stop:339 length:147 start_codon:yes stop_codon:yes gene_type:complete